MSRAVFFLGDEIGVVGRLCCKSISRLDDKARTLGFLQSSVEVSMSQILQIFESDVSSRR